VCESHSHLLEVFTYKIFIVKRSTLRFRLMIWGNRAHIDLQRCTHRHNR